MSSNSYNPYVSYTEPDSSLNSSTSPKMSQDELDAELEFWIATQFTFDMPPMLEDDLPLKLKDTKVETENRRVTVNPSTSKRADVYYPQEVMKQYLESINESYPPSNLLTDVQQKSPITPLASASTAAYQPIIPAIALPIPTDLNVEETTALHSQLANVSTLAAPASHKHSVMKTIHDTRESSSVSVSSTDDQLMLSQQPQSPQQLSDPEYSAKVAAEEDKRRRNTAASARFRIKKKMREQALERTAREMSVKVETLENKLRELELENKWLRSLVIEKDPRLLDVERPGKRRRPGEDNVESASTST